MKNLIKILNNKIDYESNKPKQKQRRGGTGKERRLAYKLGGYWFCFTRKQWSVYTGVSYGSLCGRCNQKRPVGQVLGYEPFKAYQRKTDESKLISNAK